MNKLDEKIELLRGIFESMVKEHKYEPTAAPTAPATKKHDSDGQPPIYHGK
jgi:hypothetical protein